MPLVVYPLMLIGLLAAALPVLIHFLTRPKPVALRFPAFRLLLDAGGGRQALDRLRTIILLCLRCLALIALVLAFSWPLWQRGGQAAPEQSQRAVVIVDASASMGATQGGIPLFTQARSQAADYLTRLERGSSAAVILAAARPQPILPALSTNLAALHEGLREATVTYEGVDPAAALSLAAQMLEGSGRIVVFSDLQRSNWGAVDFSQLGSVQVDIRPVSSEAVENAGITHISLRPSHPVAGETATVEVSIFNAAPRGRELSVVLETSGASLRRQVAVGAYASSQVSFSIGQPAVGVHPGEIRLEPSDAMPSDDVRRFVLSVAPRLEALVVSDSPLHEAASGAAFVARAFDPLSDGRSGIRAQRAQAQALDRQQLETAAVIALVPPLHLPGEVAALLARRLADGIVLFVVCDGRERGDGHQALAQVIGASEGALNLPWHPGEAQRHAEGQAPLIQGLPRGPLRAFTGLDEQPFAPLRIHRYRQGQTASAHAEATYLRHADASPALLVEPFGRGGLVLMNMPVEPELSNLVGTPLFPALLHESLLYLRSQGEAPQAFPGRSWSLLVDHGGTEDIRVRAPSGAPVESQILARGRQTRLALPPVAEPGLYAVQAGDELVGYGVVNLDPRESDTRPIAAVDLIDPDGETPVFVYEDDRRLALAGRPRVLWPWLWALAAAFLALEMLLTACWRRRQPGREGRR
ncbi:MAG: VWA domain-containing protein [Planctomycetota bacterium]|nr:MAG: VWA domain-containing protein [Planctomycetota bacterium]